MGVKRGRGRTSSPTQSRSSLLVKRGGESFSNHKIWVAERGEKVGVWHGTLVFGVQTKKGAEYLSSDTPPHHCLMFRARGVFSRLLCLYWQVFGGMSRKVGRWGRGRSKPIARLPSPPVYTCSVVTLAYSAVFILEVLKFEEDDWGNPICRAIKMGMALGKMTQF